MHQCCAHPPSSFRHWHQLKTSLPVTHYQQSAGGFCPILSEEIQMSTPQPASDKRGMGPGSADHLWMGEHPQNSSLKAWGRTCYISPKKRNGVSCRTAISSAAMLCLSTAKNILHLMSITVFVRSASQLWVQGFHHECRLLTGCSGEQATYCKLTGHSSQTRSPSCTATSMGLAVALCSSSW